MNDRQSNIARRDSAAPAPQEHRTTAVVQSPSGQMLAQLVASNPLLPRIHMAMMFPRDPDRFWSGFREEVVASPEGMVYAKPQGKDKLRGPSIRMAEVAARHFRNLWVSEPKVEERDNRVTVTVEALDLETNVSEPGTASTSLVKRDRTRMSEDVVSNLVSATVSKARRNAIIALIGRGPFDELVGEVIDLERKRAAGLSPEQKAGEWERAVRWWTKAGVTEADLLRFCQARSPADVTPEALVDLRQACVAVQKEGVPPRVALGLDTEEPPQSVPDFPFNQDDEP